MSFTVPSLALDPSLFKNLMKKLGELSKVREAPSSIEALQAAEAAYHAAQAVYNAAWKKLCAALPSRQDDQEDQEEQEDNSVEGADAESSFQKK